MTIFMDRAPRRATTAALGALITWLSFLTSTEPAHAIPVFARKYRTSCITCHAGFPKLNSVGEAFRRNGYQFPREDLEKIKEEPIPRPKLARLSHTTYEWGNEQHLWED